MPTIKLVMTDEELANVDRIRGTIPREPFVKDLLRASVLARDQFDGPCWLRIKATARKGAQPEGVRFLPGLDG